MRRISSPISNGSTTPAPQLEAYFADLRQKFPTEPDGVPKLPELTSGQTREWLAQCGRTDAAIQDAAAHSTEVSERVLARGNGARLAADLETLKKTPERLVKAITPELDDKDQPKPLDQGEVKRAVGFILADHGKVEKRVGEFERSMAGPTDEQRLDAGLKASEDFRDHPPADPRITLGMSQLLSSQEQSAYCALDDRFQAVKRVNRFLNYDLNPADKKRERDDMGRWHGVVLSTAPEGLQQVYAESNYLRNGDGFEEKNRVLSGMAKADAAVTKIQQRDGIGNDGSFKLPMLSEDQSKEWLARCERIEAAQDQVRAKGGLHTVRSAAAQSFHVGEADMARLTAMPKALQEIEKSGLSADQKRGEVDKLFSQYDQIDRNTQEFEKGFASRTFADRMADAWGRVRDAARSLNPFRSSSTPAPAATPQPIVAPQAPAAPHDAPAHTADDKSPAPQPLSLSQSHDDHITVSSGEVGHEMAKGPGFAAIGKVDQVKHDGNTVEVDYTLRGQHFDVKIDEKTPAGKAMGDAAEQLKPGEAFKMSIGRDRTGREVAQVEDRSTGHSVQVDRAGNAQQKEQAPDLSRSRESAGR